MPPQGKTGVMLTPSARPHRDHLQTRPAAEARNAAAGIAEHPRENGPAMTAGRNTGHA